VSLSDSFFRVLAPRQLFATTMIHTVRSMSKIPASASIMAADKIRPAALKVGIRLESGQRFGFHNFRHSLATWLAGART
jgi:integrase